jgi:ectoine hydroxylase-related dioxygenase (phytanoyl-CoA dioxygenase family)
MQWIRGTAIAIFFIFSLSLSATETRGFLTPDDIALFYKQGYLLKRKALIKEEIESLNHDITAVIDRALEEMQNSEDPVFSDDEQILHIDGSRVVYKRRADHSLSIARINGCAGMQPNLLTTIRSEKMIHTFFELLGTTDLEHLISQIHPKLPGDGISFPSHRDIQFRKSFDPNWQDILGNGSYAVCLIPIDHMTPENGGLWVDRNNYPEPQGVEEDLEWIYAEPGDLLFMHPYLYHGSGTNANPALSRKLLLTGFCAFGANHRTYPGACVNTRITLTEEGNSVITLSPWSQDSATNIGH